MPGQGRPTGVPSTVAVVSYTPAMKANAIRWLAPTWDHEIALWHGGYPLVAGVDEVGRGAIAGPLVAAAVIMPPHRRSGTNPPPALCGIKDSKQLTALQRDRAFEVIHDLAVDVGIGIIAPSEIDRIGIVAGNRRAMEDAILNLNMDPDAVLLDAVVTDLGHFQIGLIDGDARSFSIAAASIIAKVTRDRMMRDQDSFHPQYGFGSHKGYGVARHIAAIMTHGPCCLHRHTFAPVRHLTVGVDDPA